jgi:hypothetical protein
VAVVENEVKAATTILDLQATLAKFQTGIDEAAKARNERITSEAANLAAAMTKGPDEKGTDWLEVIGAIEPLAEKAITQITAALQARAPSASFSPQQAAFYVPGTPGPAAGGMAMSPGQAVPPAGGPTGQSAGGPTHNQDQLLGYLMELSKIDGSTKSGKAELAVLKRIAGRKVANGMKEKGLTLDMLDAALDNLENILPADENQEGVE